MEMFQLRVYYEIMEGLKDIENIMSRPMDRTHATYLVGCIDGVMQLYNICNDDQMLALEDKAEALKKEIRVRLMVD